MVEEGAVQHVEIFGIDGGVVVPPDLAVGLVVTDGVLVLRAAAGMGSGVRVQRTISAQFGLAAAYRLFDQHRFEHIPSEAADLVDPRQRG